MPKALLFVEETWQKTRIVNPSKQLQKRSEGAVFGLWSEHQINKTHIPKPLNNIECCADIVAFGVVR